ncbi:hypothetical protein [Streptomyces sp. SID10815]|uniref:hypothetical protein n=1 Tax=Streptomyces sp. SID10815 TaxID=2706027 RepID=UPI0013C6F59D|nr:hypothetical protein [Streptomyces sp. SID10815]NEA52388.1 hypothetical protein [Streptomyces sp. SID10815]
MSIPTIPAPSSAPTEPPSPTAMAALERLERAFGFTTVEVAAHVTPSVDGLSVADRLAHESASYVRVTPEVARAVTEYDVAAEHARDLAAVAASGRMSDLDADSLAAAEDLMAGARARLAAAGHLDLIGVAA